VLRLLGRFEIQLDNEPVAPPSTAKARSLLAYLALRAGEPIRRETLMSEFWPDADTTSARNNLKTTLSSVRRTFRERGADPDSILEVTRDVVRWIAPTVVDSREFAAYSCEIVDEHQRALALYAGEFLPGDISEWAAETRESLATHFENILRAELAAAPSASTAERLLALDPFSDEAYLALIEDALATGNRRSAQAIYRRYAASLAEVDGEPPRDLAARVGLRPAADRASLGFFGRSDELAEVQRIAASSARTIIITGVSGIGKSAFIEHALQKFPDLAGRLVEVPQEELAAMRARFPEAEELELTALTHDEVSLALRRRNAEASADTIDAIWQRSFGHPAVLAGLLSQLDRLDAGEAASVSRLRLSRELERRFETLLHAKGNDVAELAVWLALEPRLDDDDLAVLLDWSTARVLDARERSASFGAAAPHVMDAALRTLPTSRRTHAIEHIARRLKLHEDPLARADAAQLLVQLGRRTEAARAYLEAARAFAAATAWENTARTVDAGIAALESLQRSDDVDALARELHLLKGRALYEQGSFFAAMHALQVVLDVSDPHAHSEARTSALIVMGHALVRMDLPEPAREIARQAHEEAVQSGAVANELAADVLTTRVLRDNLAYGDAIEIATRGFERATTAREWTVATNFANLVIEISRRRLRLDAAFAWSSRQLDAAVLAGPVLEAEARHMLGSVRAVVNDLDGALEEFRRALALVEMYRRRRPASATPAGQLEWMLHHALAHTHTRTGNIEQALRESEWLVRSPWMLNSPMSSWQGISVAVDARLAAGSPRDIAAARALVDRIPPLHTRDGRAVLEPLARARVAAVTGVPGAPMLIRDAFDALAAFAPNHPDQIHPYFFRLAESARGIEDFVSLRAAELGRHYEAGLIAAAGVLYARNEKTGAG
jgi:SARP family transcriptional regulator, regulator of embCAB operon